MKLIEVSNQKSDDIINPLGKPPADIQEILTFFDGLESDFITGMYGRDVSGQQFVQGFDEILALGTQKTVNIQDLIPIESHLSRSHLLALKKGDDNLKRSSDTPVVYLYGGKMFLVDGNHRVAADYLDKQDSISANVVDIKKIQKYIKMFNA